MAKAKTKEIAVKEENTAMSIPNANQAEVLIAQAIQAGTPVETMERLLAMRKELKQEAAKEAYDRALAQFQAECPTIDKTKKVLNKDGSVRYAYAPIEVIVDQIKPVAQKWGLSYTVDSLVEDSFMTAVCKITHEVGHSETSSFKVPIDKDGYMSAPQKFASALTFAKRYAFCNALGILTGDQDDDATIADTTPAPQPKDNPFDMIKKAVAKCDEKALKEFQDKMKASKKYTPEQVKEFNSLVTARLEELSKAKK